MSSKIIEETLGLIEERTPGLDEIRAEDVCIGLGYTGVRLNTGHVGVCYTLQSEMAPHCCSIVERAGTLAHSQAMELAELATSWDIGEGVVGIATMNALSQIILEREDEEYSIAKGDLIDFIQLDDKDTVALVGNIEPFVKALRAKVEDIYVLERNPMLRDRNTLPDTACEKVLPDADVVLISGSSIPNKTIDRVLEFSKGAREVGVVGASSSMIPDALFKHGTTILGGIRAVEAEKLMHIVAEGGGTPQIMTAAEFTVIRR